MQQIQKFEILFGVECEYVDQRRDDDENMNACFSVAAEIPFKESIPPCPCQSGSLT